MVFRFGDTDAKTSAKLLKKQDDALSKVLKETVPGLITASGSTGAEGVTSSSSNPLLASMVSTSDNERSVVAGSSQQHRLLIPADALHVTVLFQPTLAFLDRVNASFPASLAVPITDAQSLLDEFVLNVYLPQLEEKVQVIFQDTITAGDAFHEDSSWKVLASAPLVKV